MALGEGNLIVNSSQGGGSKDTWVLAPDAPPSRSTGERSTAVSEVSPRQFGPGSTSTPGGPAQEEAQQQ